MKLNLIKSRLYFLLAIVALSCSKDGATVKIPTLRIVESDSPIDLENIEAKFYKDLVYGEFNRNTFDIFTPESSNTTGLVIFFHGGGFTGGDKSIPYNDISSALLIRHLLANKIAFASVNYRYLEEREAEGILKPLNDCKRALQFMKYHSKSLNIDKEKVLLAGSSAGAGTSLWLAFTDDMAINETADQILKESTRVQGVFCTETQSSYDVLEWHNSTFHEYQSLGLDFDTIKELVTEETLFRFYGVNSIAGLNSTAVQQSRVKLDMLNLMTNDDPEFFVSNSNNKYIYPTTSDELLHHPLHSKALMDKSVLTGVKAKFYIPSMDIDTRNGENIADFIIRKIGQ